MATIEKQQREEMEKLELSVLKLRVDNLQLTEANAQLRTRCDALIEVLVCAKALLAWQWPAASFGQYKYIRDTDGSRAQLLLLEAAINEAEKLKVTT